MKRSQNFGDKNVGRYDRFMRRNAAVYKLLNKLTIVRSIYNKIIVLKKEK